MSTLYQFTAKRLNGAVEPLEQYQGQVLLIVNTASKCGFTPQFAGLEQLYQRYKAQGFSVLGFPCNQFGGQDPASNREIGEFCQVNYGVSFPMFEKIEVNGEYTHPLFQYLKTQATGLLDTEMIKWNFTKFLVAKDGTVIKRFAPTTKPEDIAGDIEKLLVE